MNTNMNMNMNFPEYVISGVILRPEIQSHSTIIKSFYLILDQLIEFFNAVWCQVQVSAQPSYVSVKG